MHSFNRLHACFLTHSNTQASATPRVQESIIKCLGLSSPVVITNSFNRPNIAITVRHKCLLGVAGTDNDVVEVRAACACLQLLPARSVSWVQQLQGTHAHCAPQVPAGGGWHRQRRRGGARVISECIFSQHRQCCFQQLASLAAAAKLETLPTGIPAQSAFSPLHQTHAQCTPAPDGVTPHTDNA